MPMTAQLIGGPTLVLEINGLRIITDPTFDEPRDYPVMFEADVVQPPHPLRKTAPPACQPEEIGRVDIALVSHDHHEDNLDRKGREFLKTVSQVYTTETGAKRLGGGAIGVENYTASTYQLPDGRSVTVTGVPAHHGPDGIWQAVGPVTGFVLTGDIPTTYVAGDNSSVDVVREIATRFPDVELAVLFAGNPGWDELADGVCITMSGETCVEVSDLWPDALVVPVHYDSWSHFREGSSGIRAAFSAAGKAGRLHVLTAGEPEVILHG
ncbi:MBL fold metallo-hydrolase [Streptomyces sp. NPDC005811]|uniref:MBL fold metallo-hydrolase n=1 Tax=Streptomyces sp. NPDC005811 TaxID=3154565 RepID=UPI0033E13FC4